MALTLSPINDSNSSPDSIYQGAEKINNFFAQIVAQCVLKDNVIETINNDVTILKISPNKVSGIPINPVSANTPTVSGDLTVIKDNPAIILAGTELNGINVKILESAGVISFSFRVGSTGSFIDFLKFDPVSGFDLKLFKVQNSFSKIVERAIYFGDETEKTSTSVGGDTVVKIFRVYRDSLVAFMFTRMTFVCEIRSTYEGQSVSVKAALAGSTFVIGSTSSAAYVIVKSVIDVSTLLADPSLTLVQLILTVTSGNTGYLRLLECYLS